MLSQKKSFWLTSNGLAALALIGAVIYFLLMEHRQHLFQALPFLIILLCPLMHVFMHGGHGGHQHGDHSRRDGSANNGANDEKNGKGEAYRRGFEAGKNNPHQGRRGE